MGENLQIWATSASQINLYYIFVLLSFFYLIIKYKNNLFFVYVLLFFYTGLFSVFSKSIFDYYKIIITVFTIYWIYKLNPIKINSKSNLRIFSFILFSFAFLLTAYLNNDYFTISFSQYSRYFVFFGLFYLLIKVQQNSSLTNQLNKLIFEILLVQIVLSVIKIIIIGGPRESLVGSVSSQGGAPATTLPILGFIFVWIKNKGILNRKDWLFIIGLIFIGFAGAKRAVWFIMPFIIAAFMYYVPKVVLPKKYIIISLVLVPLIFYFGLRLSPTLNPDHKIWGKFDLQYALDYTEYYSLGDFDEGETPTRGRINSAMLVFEDLLLKEKESADWFGHGLRFMFASTFEEFSQMGFDISHKGSATGVYQTLIANGYLGVFTFLFFVISLIAFTRNKRVRNVLLFLFLWEYLFYTGIIMREYSVAFLFIYAITFAKSPMEKGNKLILNTASRE